MPQQTFFKKPEAEALIGRQVVAMGVPGIPSGTCGTVAGTDESAAPDAKHVALDVDWNLSGKHVHEQFSRDEFFGRCFVMP